MSGVAILVLGGLLTHWLSCRCISADDRGSNHVISSTFPEPNHRDPLLQGLTNDTDQNHPDWLYNDLQCPIRAKSLCSRRDYTFRKLIQIGRWYKNNMVVKVITWFWQLFVYILILSQDFLISTNKSIKTNMSACEICTKDEFKYKCPNCDLK